MKSKELKAARMLLMLKVSEAAEEIGTCTSAAWREWEAGTVRVPEQVETQMHELLAQRLNLIERCADKLASGKRLRLPFFPSFELYKAKNPKGTRLTWRISQSVAALYFAEGSAELI